MSSSESIAACPLWRRYSDIYFVRRITIATLLSFLSAIFAGTHRFCYSALASSSVVLILPVSRILLSESRIFTCAHLGLYCYSRGTWTHLSLYRVWRCALVFRRGLFPVPWIRFGHRRRGLPEDVGQRHHRLPGLLLPAKPWSERTMVAEDSRSVLGWECT